jgi:hypothetical protein
MLRPESCCSGVSVGCGAVRLGGSEPVSDCLRGTRLLDNSTDRRCWVHKAPCRMLAAIDRNDLRLVGKCLALGEDPSKFLHYATGRGQRHFSAAIFFCASLLLTFVGCTHVRYLCFDLAVSISMPRPLLLPSATASPHDQQAINRHCSCS